MLEKARRDFREHPEVELSVLTEETEVEKILETDFRLQNPTVT